MIRERRKVNIPCGLLVFRAKSGVRKAEKKNHQSISTFCNEIDNKNFNEQLFPENSQRKQAQIRDKQPFQTFVGGRFTFGRPTEEN